MWMERQQEAEGPAGIEGVGLAVIGVSVGWLQLVRRQFHCWEAFSHPLQNWS